MEHCYVENKIFNAAWTLLVWLFSVGSDLWHIMCTHITSRKWYLGSGLMFLGIVSQTFQMELY